MWWDQSWGSHNTKRMSLRGEVTGWSARNTQNPGTPSSLQPMGWYMEHSQNLASLDSCRWRCGKSRECLPTRSKWDTGLPLNCPEMQLWKGRQTLSRHGECILQHATWSTWFGVLGNKAVPESRSRSSPDSYTRSLVSLGTTQFSRPNFPHLAKESFLLCLSSPLKCKLLDIGASVLLIALPPRK